MNTIHVEGAAIELNHRKTKHMALFMAEKPIPQKLKDEIQHWQKCLETAVEEAVKESDR